MARLIVAGRAVAIGSVALLVAAAPGGAAPPEGQMTWAVHVTLAARWLDPAESEGITPFMILYAVHDALLKPMPHAYEFVLRVGPRFNNGEPVTAEDAKFSFDRYRGVSAKLLKQKARELDRKKREELLHQIQRILHERVVFAPIWENAFIRGIGPRVEEAALNLIPAFPYSAPFEEVRLKRR
jgi:ABC-type transport system substrate-binding protein